MNDIIVNATGSDFIRLWYLRGNHIQFRRFRNRSWIFVSGTPYDLDFLTRQLDDSGRYEYTEATGNNVYGPVEGIRIDVNPSGISDLVTAIENIGLGRKYSIYNADINPVLRFMSERSLRFFQLSSPEGHDPVGKPWYLKIPIQAYCFR